MAYKQSTSDLYVAASQNAGTSFGAPVRVNDKAAAAYYWGSMDIAVDAASGRLYAIWEDLRNRSIHVFLASSTDRGQTFTANVQVDSTSQNGHHASLALGPLGEVYAAWSGYDGSAYDVYVARSDDQGQTFGPGVRVHASPAQDDKTALAVGSSGKLFVAWNTFDGDVLVATSTDRGATFRAPVTANDVAGRARGLALGARADECVVAWSDVRNDTEGDIHADASTGGGTAFGQDVLVNDDRSRYQEDPDMAVSPSGALYLVWQDFRANRAPDRYDVWGAVSVDGGATWGTNFRVNAETREEQMNPRIAVDAAGSLHAAWRDARDNGSFDIYFGRGR